MKAEVKIGSKFESKTGRLFEIVSFSKNPNIITYKITIGKLTETRNGSLNEVTKHTQIA